MQERPLPKPPKPIQRAGAIVCHALAASLLIGSVPVHAQRRAAGANPVPASRAGTPVTLNFVNADIEAVSRAIGAMLDRPIIVDPRVKGTITVYSEQPISVREAYLNYLAALRGLGFTVVENAGLLKVVPEADAKLQAGTVQIGPPALRGDQIVTQVFRLSYESANNLVTVLRPLISPNNTINADPTNNTLVITDYADNLQRIARIIAALDTSSSTDVEVISLKHAVASDLAPLVQRLAEGGTPGAPVVPGMSMAGGVSVIADPRSNALIVRAPNAARLASLHSLVAQLDTPSEMGGGPSGNIYVVHLKNADAGKLAQVLRAAYQPPNLSGTGTTGNFQGAANISSPGQPSTPQQVPASNIGGTGSNAGSAMSAAAAQPVTPSGNPQTGGFVQADPATNSLIITAPEPMYRQLRALIDTLDVRRPQVYIESMIVELSGDNAADVGLQWQGLLGKQGDKYGVFAGTNYNVSGVPNIINLAGTLAGQGAALSSAGVSPALPGAGLNIGLLKNYGGTYTLGAIAQLLQSETKTNIISTPNLLTLDNEEAKIVVGKNVPFITGQFTNTGTSTSSPFQTIERKDVGITLRIKPQVGDDGTVRMAIYQESSSLSSQVAPGATNAGPTTDTRSIETNVVVNDGDILALGGLIQDNYTDEKSKVPLLGDIPVIGQLFRSESRSRTRTNLMVFLRPVVLHDERQSNELTLERYNQMRTGQQNDQPPHNFLFPINESPVLPAPVEKSTTAPPLAPPDTTPKQHGAVQPPQAPQPAQSTPPQSPPSANSPG